MTESVDIVCIKKWKVREEHIQTRLNIQTSAKLTDSIINAKNSKTSSYRIAMIANEDQMYLEWIEPVD
jgi:hypothetical protein